MKLSEIKGERCLDVVAELIEPIASIASDEDFTSLIKPGEIPKGMTKTQYFAQRLRKAVPVLIERHKDEVVTILATVNGQSTGEYLEGLTLSKLFGDTIEIMTDQDILGFTRSAASTSGSSGSASESTGDLEGSGA